MVVGITKKLSQLHVTVGKLSQLLNLASLVIIALFCWNIAYLFSCWRTAAAIAISQVI